MGEIHIYTHTLHTLEDVARVLNVPVLLAVAVPAHANGLASLNGSAVAVVAGDLSLVHMLILP